MYEWLQPLAATDADTPLGVAVTVSACWCYIDVNSFVIPAFSIMHPLFVQPMDDFLGLPVLLSCCDTSFSPVLIDAYMAI